MANQDELNILARGVDAWNAWRQRHPSVRPDLSDAEIVFAELNGIDLHDAVLVGVDLANTDLTAADLRQADLTGAYARDTVFRQADLSGATLAETEMRDADFTASRLVGACFENACIVETNFRRADLTGADLTGADLMHADLTAAVLRDARLVDADMRCEGVDGADFTGADLSGVVLRKKRAGREGECSLNLLRARGIDSTRFTSHAVLVGHMEDAFRQAHHDATVKSECRSELFTTLRSISLLGQLYALPQAQQLNDIEKVLAARREPIARRQSSASSPSDFAQHENAQIDSDWTLDLFTSAIAKPVVAVTVPTSRRAGEADAGTGERRRDDRTIAAIVVGIFALQPFLLAECTAPLFLTWHEPTNGPAPLRAARVDALLPGGGAQFVKALQGTD